MIKFDPYKQLLKPKSLYGKYQDSGSKFKYGITMNHIYDRGIEKVKDNRSKINDFLSD